MKPTPVPVCVTTPGEMPVLDPRRMPALAIACPEPRDATAQRYRRPLWRSFKPREPD